MENWLVWLNILMSILDSFIEIVLPFLVLLWVLCAVVSFSYDFIKPFIWFRKNY